MTKAEREKEWETRIADFRASGQSAKDWCAANGLKTERLWYWLRRYKTDKATPSTQWIPVEVSEQLPKSKCNALLIRVGEASIEVKPGFDPGLLSQIVRALTLC